ncbi:hypothetical protein LMG24235_08583 [Paraburkholderia sabiae]|nr:hypothetical protein LMG24235_08583 [Paraburkholderia sabiae]
MLLAAGLLAAVALVGCKSLPTQTPAQIAANVCLGVQPEINVLTKSGVFTHGTQATLTKQVQPTVPVVVIVTGIDTVLSLQPATTAPTTASAES